MRRRVGASARALAVFALGALVGCGGEPPVVRVYDGRVVAGSYVPPEAYSAYLKGVLAEEAGDLRSALSAFAEAAREDDEDPEPFTRIGDVRCQLDAHDKAADEAFGTALKIDPSYAPAHAAQAACAGLRGQTAEALAIALKVAPVDRMGVALEAGTIRLAARRPARGGEDDARMRQRAIALTVASGEHPAAWEALVAWGRATSDDELLARGLLGLITTAPMRSNEVERGALELLGVGQAALARRVAAAVADASEERGIMGVHDATVARLAIDEAILDGDQAAAMRRATRGHVALGEVAARALILERPDVAAPIARALAAADPGSGCARMVLGALDARTGRPEPAARAPKGVPTDRPATSCVAVFAERLVTSGGPEVARAWVAQIGALPMAAHDPVAGPALVELAARGVVAEASLPLELRLELAARRREPPPRVDPATLDPRGTHGEALDPKHALLWHTLVDPNGAPAKALLARLGEAADRDPIVGFSLARSVLASTSASPAEGAWAAVRRALASAPADPLLLAIAVEIAKRAGRTEEVPRARVRLMAVAQTPAERALAGD